MLRVLVAEDEATIRGFIVLNLRRHGYEPVEASSGDEALEIFDREDGNFQIALLDIMMPGTDGLEVCRRLRAMNSTMGIIMLTAKAQESDKIKGLGLGADDYITKPFSPSELMARLESLSRRVEHSITLVKENPVAEVLTSGEFVLNLRRRTLSKNGEDIELTQLEYQIMEYFFTHPGQELDREDILLRVWGDGYAGEEKIVDVNIRRLRMKIEDDPSKPVHVKTVWGRGYKWIK
ncbi:MAG: response regulator transcription factor [Clostridia bacterium]|nr:response regulator transcription factor [Clostridia bacterium]